MSKTKLAIVTGGSRGLGKALVELLVNSQWQVFELSRSGESVHNVCCDLSKPVLALEVGQTLFAELSANQWDEIAFIDNAGDLSPIRFVSNLNTSEIATNISINQISSFTLISEFMTAFRDHPVRKAIVNISSGAAHTGYAGWSLYCASKAACEMFIRTLAVEEEIHPDPFCAINYEPGIIDTAMQGQIRATDESNFPDLQEFIGYHNKGDLRTPKSVAEQIVRLLSTELISGERYVVS